MDENTDAVLAQATLLVSQGASLTMARDDGAAGHNSVEKTAVATRVSAADRDLVERCVAGQRVAQVEIFERFQRRVYSVCLRILGRADAEEVTQEVFIRLFRGLANYRGDAALGTWIYRLAVNASLSRATRKTPDLVPDDELSRMPDRGARRDVALAVALERALTALPPGYRTVVVLHDIEGLSHEEIAAVLECDVGTSKSQLHKARAKLRIALSESGELR